MIPEAVYPKFRLHDPTTLWRGLKAKTSGGLDRIGPYKNSWA